MNLKHLLLVGLMLSSLGVAAQEIPVSTLPDTTLLEEVEVSAYMYNRPAREVPAPVSVLNDVSFQRNSPTSLLPALNTIPGVRMEERSPGSYRLAVRGSSLRSPFGIRNVKVYWNEMPLTDAGGNTYLNLIDLSAINTAEVIKGPGSSLYGAGNGGVLMMKNTYSIENSITAALTAGSFGMKRYDLHAAITQQNSNMRLTYAHQDAEGYRDQTNMARDVIQFTTESDLNDQATLSAALFYTDLYYQTPGGLTLQQAQEDPTQARPAGGPNPGTEEQHAAVYNKTFYTGIGHEYRWNNSWTTRTSIYGAFTKFENSAILNYERKTEQGFGGRTVTSYQFNKGKFIFGAELQNLFAPVKTYQNLQGTPGLLRSDDEISTFTYFVFTQAEFELPAQFFLTAGVSFNELKVDYTKLATAPVTEEARNFDALLSPRVALLKRFSPLLTAFLSYSQGYSPPTSAELYPSTSTFNNTLKPEIGENWEAGVKGSFFKKQFNAELTAYLFNLDNAIVIQRTDGGSEYFINAGETNQQGLEVQLAWEPMLKHAPVDLKLWINYTLNNYSFEKYIAPDGVTDYSGNDLTGVAPNTVVSGFDVKSDAGVYFYSTYTYTDNVPLNDNNTVYSDASHLLVLKLGYQLKRKSFTLDFFAGIDNVLDEQYSLGHDLNAFGARYYNPASTRNYFGGVMFRVVLGKNG